MTERAEQRSEFSVILSEAKDLHRILRFAQDDREF
jgi:hypothetical protein